MHLQTHSRLQTLGLATWLGLLPGLLLAGLIAAAAMGAARLHSINQYGLGALTLAIVFGIALGNSVFPKIAATMAPGVDFAKGQLLRAGIILYGLRITLQDIAAVGMTGFLVDLAVAASVFGLAILLGMRVFKLDRQTSILIGSGSAICGAAAVMAVEPVVRGEPHKVSVAVATVVVFGTIGMFAYPLLYPHLGLDARAYGMYAGSTIHEVAQVVVAGKAGGEQAEATAVIAKMLRVMLLAPFLLLLSTWFARKDSHGGKGRMMIPWFALWFIVVSAINSLQVLPDAWVDGLVQLDTVLLATAMAALGLRTHASAVRKAGIRPLLLAATLFAWLVLGGYALNIGIPKVLGWLG